MDKDAILEKIRHATQEIYKNAPHELPFHGWHHIEFVHKQATRFALDLDADIFLVAVAAYVHDLNYVVKAISTIYTGNELRIKILRDCGIDEENVLKIESIIEQADRSIRTADISLEAKALSDGDTLFKSLPITPVIFTKAFLDERSMPLHKMADLILKSQTPLFEKDIFFYSPEAKKYMKWAKTNLELWQNVVEYFKNDDLALGTSGIEELDKYLS